MLKDIGVMGFHQVEISLLGAPSDSYDLGRRINTFWQVGLVGTDHFGGS